MGWIVALILARVPCCLRACVAIQLSEVVLFWSTCFQVALLARYRYSRLVVISWHSGLPLWITSLQNDSLCWTRLFCIIFALVFAGKFSTALLVWACRGLEDSLKSLSAFVSQTRCSSHTSNGLVACMSCVDRHDHTKLSCTTSGVLRTSFSHLGEVGRLVCTLARGHGDSVRLFQGSATVRGIRQLGAARGLLAAKQVMR